MAKRKRLTPARPDYLGPAPGVDPADPDRPSMVLPGAAPISRITREFAQARALEDVTDELRRIREDGRLVLALDLDSIDTGALVRDRIDAGGDDMAALVQSLRERGQQTPIEVMELSEGRYGLISGWRRLTALRRLRDDTGAERFGRVQALLRRPDTASDAYVAMVEENEIRVGLSYYERARIAARATEQGVYPTEKAALRALFATASRAKRSKIRSFLGLYHGLEGSLRFASAIPERLGLRLAKALAGDRDLGARLRAALEAAPPATAAEETALLERALVRPGAARTETRAGAAQGARNIRVQAAGQGGARRITLSGAGVDDAFEAALRDWIARRHTSEGRG